MRSELGKISKARFGLGGYQGCQIVFQFLIEGDSWGCTKIYECGWGHVSEKELKEPGSTYKWTHEGRIKQIGEKGWEVIQLMKDAKVSSLEELIGKPVRAHFNESRAIIGFEILKEVL